MSITDVEQALINARELEDYWLSNGWESLEIQEGTMINEVVEVYPLVGRDVKVQVTIVLLDKIYSVPLEDVSPINSNECLVIGKDDLYFDWEERIKSNLGLLFQESELNDNKGKWWVTRYLGVDSNIRVVKSRVSDYSQ